MAERGLLQSDVVCVYRKGKGYQFGIIFENADTLSSSDEEDADEDRLKKGFVRVAWYPAGRESVIAENKVKLVERSLMPGDVTQRLLPGQDSQSGVIMDMEVKCHLHIKQTNKYIYNVNSKDLLPLQKFEDGQAVVLGDSLGRVMFVNTYVIVQFSDGARCKAEESDLANFDDIIEKKEMSGYFGSGEFFEGQELRGSLYNLVSAEWLHSTSRHSARTAKTKGNHTVTVTVEKVITDSVEVQWVFRIFSQGDPNLASAQHENTISGENLKKLKVLDWFDYSNLEMSDLMMYRIKNDDRISIEEPSQVFEPTKLSIKNNLGDPVSASNKKATANDAATASVCMEGGSSDTLPNGEEPGPVATAQEDGDFEDDSDTAEEADKTGSGGNKSVRSKKRRGGGGSGFKATLTKFKSGKQQGQKGASSTGSSSSNRHKKHGLEKQVVADSLVNVEVVFTNSTATVLWQDGSVDYDIPSYDLFPVDLDTYDFFPGDFVISQNDMESKPDYGSVVRCSHEDRTCLVNWYKVFDGIKEKEPILLEANDEVSVYDIKEHTVFNFRHGQIVGLITSLDPNEAGRSKFVGQILKLDPPGRVTVKWSDGVITQCFPQEIFKVMEEDDDDDDTSDDSSYEGDSDASGDTWETESEQEIIGEEDDKGEQAASIIAKQKQELQTLLARAESALVRLKTLLNSFDVSMTAPECFHDIIRIYRSCHDVDKILRSSFFNDSELQELIAQAKLELKRDKASKISKHLSQLLESWGKSQISTCKDSDPSHKKTLRIGSSLSCNILNLTMKYDVADDSGVCVDENNEKFKSEVAAGGMDTSSPSSDPLTFNETAGDSGTEESGVGKGAVKNTRVLRKEFSEPVISSRCQEDRLSSEPEGMLEQIDMKSSWKGDEDNDGDRTKLNLVGENCVGKGNKIAIAGSDNSVKMNGVRSETTTSDNSSTNNHARQLCFKICENLQKQIMKIHEEVNKRTNRIMSSAKGSNKETIRIESFREAEDSAINNDVNADTTSASSAVANFRVEAENDSSHNDGSALSQDYSKSFNTSTKPTSNDGDDDKTSQQTIEMAADHAKCKEPLGENHLENEAVTQQNYLEPISFDSDEMMTASDDVDGELVLPKGFTMVEEVGSLHKFSGQPYQPLNPRAFNTAVKKDLRLLQGSLPDGIFIKGFEDRLDLYSVMILGPSGTPYEDAFFLFDVMLPKDYPKSPPLCHYHSFCSDRLNPNLYEDGKICVSLLGTWSGKGSEMWTAKSNLLQVLLSIQGLILVREPYYNEAGFERQRGTQSGAENSRMYNEMAVLKTVQSLIRMCHNLPAMFEEESKTHLLKYGPRLIKRLRTWMIMRNDPNGGTKSGEMNHINPSTDMKHSTSNITGVNTLATQNGGKNNLEKESHIVSDKFLHLQMNGNENLSSSENTADANTINTSAVTGAEAVLSTGENINAAQVTVKASSSSSSSSLLSSLSGTRRGPEFPLLPVSRGFCLTLSKTLDGLEKGLQVLKSL